MGFWFFLVVVVYLVFVGWLFYFYKVRNRDRQLREFAATSTKATIAEGEKGGVDVAKGGFVGKKVDGGEVLKMKEEKWKDFRITIDPRNLLHPLLLERDDDGGIVIRCVVPDGVLSAPVEKVPIKTEEEMNMDYMAALNELSDSVAEWR